jgi:hypothetical protein
VSYRPWWNLEPCGCASAYARHVRLGQLKDDACKDAHAAAEAWRQKRKRGEAVTAAEARAARLRRVHAECTALRKAGVALADMPLPVQEGERAYQRESKRRRRQERVQRAGIVYRLHSEARRRGYEAAA